MASFLIFSGRSIAGMYCMNIINRKKYAGNANNNVLWSTIALGIYIYNESPCKTWAIQYPVIVVNDIAINGLSMEHAIRSQTNHYTVNVKTFLLFIAKNDAVRCTW